MTELQYIKIDRLHHHPDNPRKDLGDLSELADSIKVNGIFQNLTVVPATSAKPGAGYCPTCTLYLPSSPQLCRDGHNDRPPCKHWQDAGLYTVVIGHRRLAAAKLAGLDELPCVVSDMSYQEQISTMMVENMQRADLTLYEQAKGFQMMLDLGDTVETISEKTGFSSSTIRRRTKLLELDQEKFKKAEARGASLFDYMELDKIKSIERKNEVLGAVGTENFNSKLKQAIYAEEQEVRTAKWVELLSAFATQVESTAEYHTVKMFYTSGKPGIDRPDDADTVEYFFNISKYGSIYLMTDAQEEEQTAETPEEIRQREWDEYRKTLLKAATKQAYELRREFIKGVSATKIKKHLSDILALLLWLRSDNYSDIDLSDVSDLLDVDSPEDDEGMVEYADIEKMVARSPEKVLLAMVYCEAGDDEDAGYYASWNCKHEENEELTRLYDLLVKMGYEMSDEEKSLRDGTHELFQAVTPEDGEKDPCALCKSAHPTCDKCCATCEDSCNAIQTCRKQAEN